MKDFFKTLWLDIKRHQNIELYLVLLVIIVIFVADIFGLENDSALFEIVLAALAVMIYGLLNERHTNQRIENKLDGLLSNTGSTFFTVWDNIVLKERLLTAKEISSVISLGNYELLHSNLEVLKSFLKRGGRIRFVYINPDSSAFQMATTRRFGTNTDVHIREMKLRLHLTLRTLKELIEFAPAPDNILIKFTDYLPSSTVTLVDQKDSIGIIFVTLNDYNLTRVPSLSFILKKSDKHWFDVYSSVFENFWSNLSTEPIDLSDDYLSESY